MPYTQNNPKYDAYQWTSDKTMSEFSALVDPTGFATWSTNTDGSLHFEHDVIMSGDIPLGNWIVSTPYWTPTLVQLILNEMTTSLTGNITFTDTEFTEQFTALG